MALRRWARRLLLAMTILGLIVLAAAAGLPRIVDANRYRPLVSAWAQEATGRSVRIGTIAFDLLPLPSLSVRPLAIAESARYPGRDMLTAESLSIRLGIIGLLRGRLTFRSIVLNRPTLTLIRDAQGRWNFADLLARASAASSSAAAPSRPGGASSAPRGVAASSIASGAPGISIEEARARNGRILVYDDAVVSGRRSEVSLGPIDAAVTGWGAGPETRLELAAGLGRSVLRSRARLLADGGDRIEGEFASESLLAADLAKLLPWLGVARPSGLEIGGTIALLGTASLPLERPEAIRFRGTMRLAGLSYRDAGMARPVKGLSGTLSIDGARAAWDDFAVAIGRSSLKGKLSVEDFLRPRVAFTLSSPRLDFNELLGTFVVAEAGKAPSREAREASGGEQPPEATAALFPVIHGRGTLSLGAVRFQTFDLTKVEASVALERGVLSLKDLKGAFYGGELMGEASIDLAGPAPRYALGVTMHDVEVAPALAAYDPGLADLLRGRLSGRLDLSSAGADMQAILKSANGAATFALNDGSITSFSVLRQVAALLEQAGGKGIGREATPFQSLGAHLAIAAGRANTDDLELHSADLDLTGAGWVGLDATMKLGVVARFSKEASGGMVAKIPRLGILQDRERRLAVHFSLDGSLAGPGFRLDTRSQLGEVRERKQEEAKERVLERLKNSLRRKMGQEDQPPPEASKP